MKIAAGTEVAAAIFYAFPPHRVGSRTMHYTRFRVTLMLSRVALEYGQTW